MSINLSKISKQLLLDELKRREKPAKKSKKEIEEENYDKWVDSVDGLCSLQNEINSWEFPPFRCVYKDILKIKIPFWTEDFELSIDEDGVEFELKDSFLSHIFSDTNHYCEELIKFLPRDIQDEYNAHQNKIEEMILNFKKKIENVAKTHKLNVLDIRASLDTYNEG